MTDLLNYASNCAKSDCWLLWVQQKQS